MKNRRKKINGLVIVKKSKIVEKNKEIVRYKKEYLNTRADLNKRIDEVYDLKREIEDLETYKLVIQQLKFIINSKYDCRELQYRKIKKVINQLTID